MDSSENTKATKEYWIDGWEYHPMPLKIALITAVASAVLALLGGFANGLVIYFVIRIKKMRKMEDMDLLILNLCFSDFLSSVVVQPQVIPQILARSQIPASQLLCIHASVHFTMIFGALCLFILTLNRYISIKFPFFYGTYITEMKMFGLLATIYTIAVAIVIWVLLHGASESRVFPIIMSVLVLLIIVILFMIFPIVRTQNWNMRRQVLAVQYNQTDSFTISRRNAKLFKTNRTILYICIVFVAVWIPSMIFRVYYAIYGNFTFYIQWVHLFTVVIQIHSCVNPFLYVLRTSRVKQIFIRIFRSSQVA